MKRSDLFREYARVIDLCEGTKVSPPSCAKYDNMPFNRTPDFIGNPVKHEFALTIVEDCPVFAGDVLYHKDGYQYTVDEVEKHNNGKLAFRTIRFQNPDGDWIENYTWSKPDPFSELLQAKAKGERIVFYDGAKWIDTDVIDTVNFKPESYKVADEDRNTTTVEYPFGNKTRVEVKWKKCGITGKISAEVVE